MTEEQAKKSEKKDKESPELKEELADDELNSISGGRGVTEQSVNNSIDERIHFLEPSA